MACTPFTPEEIERLNEMKTKQLLNILHRNHRKHKVGERWIVDGDCELCSLCGDKCIGHQNAQIIRNILNTREHVVSSAESLRTRKAKIKEGRTTKEPCRRH